MDYSCSSAGGSVGYGTIESEKTSQGSPIKRMRTIPTCIIHAPACKENPTENLVSPKDIPSWQSLLHAARIRGHLAMQRLAEDLTEGTIPIVFYHRKCRNLFTMKKQLDAILTQSTEESTSSVSHKHRYIKGQRTREPLIQCQEFRSDHAIRQAAEEKQDTKILALSSRELVAAEAHYHRSCYKEYTRKDVSKSCVEVCDDESDDESETSYLEIEAECYQMLFSFTREHVISSLNVMRFSNIRKQLVDYMAAAGVKVKKSTKKHVRRKIEAEFGSNLHIINDEKGRLVMYPDKLSADTLALRNIKMKEELEQIQSNTSDMDNLLTSAALLIRIAIQNYKTKMPWPPKPSDMCDVQRYIPHPLQNFMNILLAGKQEPKSIAEKKQRLINSFCQDIVYGVSNGHMVMPKHVLLPFAVKTLTGNVEVINSLNRLGHGISYSKVEDVDTALCLQKLATGTNVGIALPDAIRPYVYATLAWDNIDRLEETLSGGGTSHRVNGIIVQPLMYGPELPKKHDDIAIPKKKARHIEPLTLSLPIYNAGERAGPPPLEPFVQDHNMPRVDTWKDNLFWILCRLFSSTDQTVSSWTGFNIQVHNEVDVCQDVVGYLPTINAPATELTTVNEVLQQSLKIKDALFLPAIVVVFDQALFAKAAEIVWKNAEKFQTIVLRLGTFHTICNLLSIIGKRFRDAGLQELCVESGVIAEGSVASVMEGRRYNRAVRFHKLLMEALLRLAWLEANHREDYDLLGRIKEQLSNFCDNISQQTFQEMREHQPTDKILKLFMLYIDHLRNANGKLSSFWVSYIDMVQLMLDLIRSSREANCNLHLESVQDMLHWCFAYDKLNYARHMSIYYAQMCRLPITHPEIHHFLESGGFAVQLGSQNPFGRIPVDQTVEETVNKDTQTSGGTKCFSLNPGAISRYYLTAEYRSAFLRQLRDMLNMKQSTLGHKDLQMTRIIKDEADVQALLTMLESNWINPFDENSQELVSISSGKLATPDITEDLLHAHESGKKAYDAFKTKRLEQEPPAKKFHDPMKKLNLKTFSNLSVKKMKTTAHGKELVLKADRNLFAHMLLVAQSRKLKMEDVLSHPLGPLPMALASPDGLMRTTNKSSLGHELQNNVVSAANIPQPCCCIIDGMALVQKMRGEGTFSELASTLLGSILIEGRTCSRIDVVFDVYRAGSIKDAERLRRGSSTGTSFKNIAPGHKLHQWRKFLANSNNKECLVTFLVKEWQAEKHRKKLNDKSLFVTRGKLCYHVTSSGTQIVSDLESTQEEADTRMLLHAAHASRSDYEAIVVVSDDTDVLVLCLAFKPQIPTNIYFKCGTKTRVKYADITKVFNALGYELSQALVSFHAFTGCDTTSAFGGRGKLGPLKLLKSSQEHMNTFNTLGQDWTLLPQVYENIEKFTCLMYNNQPGTYSVNKLRYRLFCAKKGKLESHQIPPCADSLYKHCLRANYQAKIWKSALQTSPDIPGPGGHGWKLDLSDPDGGLVIDWMEGKPAPEIVLELLVCTCSRLCEIETCMCMKNSLKCTDLCKLQTCTNQSIRTDNTAQEMDDSDSDEE
ncbi:hypothetical protein GQR58_022660 [Nymphon striatum]|nr:hypothetical protein GQR58_022660 [Nymphon striatum]